MTAENIKTVTASAQINNTSDTHPNILHKMSSDNYFCPFYYKTNIYAGKCLTYTWILQTANTPATTTIIKR